MEKYFKLTSTSKVNAFGITLFQLQLIIDCKWGKKGDLGGWIESKNLSNGDARVSGNAWVSGDARVSGNAWEQSPLQIQGRRHFVCTHKHFHLKIGCHEYSFEYWKKNYKAIGKEAGYSAIEIKEYGLYIELAIKIYGLKPISKKK